MAQFGPKSSNPKADPKPVLARYEAKKQEGLKDKKSAFDHDKDMKDFEDVTREFEAACDGVFDDILHADDLGDISLPAEPSQSGQGTKKSVKK